MCRLPKERGRRHIGIQVDPPTTAFPGPAALETCYSPNLGLAQTPRLTECGPNLEKPDPYCGRRPPSAPLLPAPGWAQGLRPRGLLGTVAKGRGHRKQDLDPIANPPSFFPPTEPPSSPAFLSPVLGPMPLHCHDRGSQGGLEFAAFMGDFFFQGQEI